ncbi:MAG: TetR/AcrR family transcriptional regulator [Ilumatobacteraceae bacterium]
MTTGKARNPKQAAPRRGRPRGGNSDETRQLLVDTARRHFAERGYASTSLSAIAADAGIAPSAVYHYFDGKEALYLRVFEDTAPLVWLGIQRAVEQCDRLSEAVDVVMRGRGGPRPDHASPFLATLPTVAKLHPELSHLLQRRVEISEPAFRHMAELGIETGELPGFDVVEATAFLRVLLMGYFNERYWLGHIVPGSHEGIVKALRAIAVSAETTVTAAETEGERA